MAVYRQVHISFWQDPYIEDLSAKEKFFYLYLMTNSKTKQCGCYEISSRLIKYETGLTQQEIDGFIEKLSDGNKIRYSKENQEFLLINWLKHNSFKSPKVLACIINELENVKTETFKTYVYAFTNGNTSIDSLSIDYTKTMDTQSQKEKEKEKEKEEKEEEENIIVVDSKESPTHTKEDLINDFFEKTWSMYHNKKGKTSVTKKAKKEVFNLGDEFERCITRYNKERMNEDVKYSKQGSTFWNGGYIDYLDQNYKEPVSHIPVKQTAHTNFVQNTISSMDEQQMNEIIKRKNEERMRKRKEGDN